MPERTCIACREKREQTDLVRLCRGRDGRVRVLAGRSSQGRSAYLCPRGACFEQAARRHAFTRAFTREGKITVDLAQLWIDLQARLNTELELLDRTTANPHQHPRRSAIARLLFQLSSEPAPHEQSHDKRREREPRTAKGGQPSHG
jgi:hypothetical protein